jgi:hypothetical protein
LRPIAIGSGFGVVDVVGDDRAAARDLVADEFGGDVIGDRRTEAFAIDDMVAQHVAADVLADGDIFHFRRDDAAAGVMHLADVGACFGAKDAAADVGEGGDAARAVGAELAIVLRAGFPCADFLDIAAAADPLAAKLGQAGVDVDGRGRIGVGAAGVVEVERRLARRRLELNRAHRDLEGTDVDLAAAADRAGGDGGSGGDAGVDVGHESCLQSGGTRDKPLPSLRRCEPDQVQRVEWDCTIPLSRTRAPSK